MNKLLHTKREITQCNRDSEFSKANRAEFLVSIRNTFIYLAIFFLTSHINAQISIDNTTFSPDQLISNVFLGPGVTVSNIKVNGLPASSINEQVGYFLDSTLFSLKEGIILGTGNVQLAAGPNNSNSASMGGSGALGLDPDLAAITPNPIYDELILEFDFIPNGNNLNFKYVFASEEYDEYVCGVVNDAFGFFISGPGINGPYTNNAENIALIPGTSIPVSINTVNNGSPGSSAINGSAQCDSLDPNWQANSQFFVGSLNQVTQYDGMTVVLTASAVVQCGNTYHIKLAIGDAGDEKYDSGVFLEARSFNSTGFKISAEILNSLDTLGREGCDQVLFNFYRTDSSTIEAYEIIKGGDAIIGVDYSYIPDSISFPIGSNHEWYLVDIYSDIILEGNESINLSVPVINSCGYIDTIKSTVTISDVEPLNIEIFGDSIHCPLNGNLELFATATGGIQPYSFSWNNGDFGTTVNVNLTSSTTFACVLTDACGTSVASDSLFVTYRCELIIPNVFTPNADGINDLFTIKNLEQYGSCPIEIYNRWGSLVYKTDHYQNSWDGSGVADGVYFYVFTPKLYNEVFEPITGQVTIMR